MATVRSGREAYGAGEQHKKLIIEGGWLSRH